MKCLFGSVIENTVISELVKPRAMKPVTLEELVETSRTWNLGYTEEELSGLRGKSPPTNDTINIYII